MAKDGLAPSVPQVARSLGVDESTLRKAVSRAREGLPPVSKNPAVVDAAERIASGRPLTVHLRLSATRWPHPDAMLSGERVAHLLGVDNKTMSAAIRAAADGTPRAVADPRVAACAEVFAREARGAVPRVPCSSLLEAAGRPPTDPSPPEKAAPRPRVNKREVEALAKLDASGRRKAYRIALGALAARSSPHRRERMAITIETIRKRDGEAAIPRDIIDGVMAGRFRAFATLADWAAKARHDEPRLFVVRPGRRPEDYAIASAGALRTGEVAALTLREWAEACADAAAAEFLVDEARIFGGETAEGSGGGRRGP